GRYRMFPIIGSVVSVVGLVGVAQINGTTSYWWLLLPMVFMGFGAASVFTTTSIASQNAVDFRDLGVATATVMFFRSLGGSFGMAVFGTILNTTIRSEIPARIGIAAAEAGSLIRSPEEISVLATDARLAVVDSVAIGVSRIYWVCAAAMLCAVIIALRLPERPLRMRAGLSDAMEEHALVVELG
ncbi:MAG: transporter, partial [Ilumatobacteraceae bacterium]|nr:transporter [Ilumatobacteraceae bacterium]